jgi:retron-type reverse transcriptase
LGTENALHSTSKFINNALDSGKKVMEIFVDLAKAFNTVNHHEIINSLSNFDLKNISLNWFRSYLKNRKQIVKINSISGDEMTINYEVPQGSVIGPLLFILYINSICDIEIDGQILTYVDDTFLLFSGVTWEI